LRELLGGASLTTPCTLSKNGYDVTSNALIDSGANGFIFVNTRLAVELSKYLDVRIKKLAHSIPITGYNGEAGNPISYMLRLNITVDGRRQYNAPLLVLDLGGHDIILGRKWLAYFNILVDARRADVSSFRPWLYALEARRP
jgi:predicted aspartyl protease